MRDATASSISSSSSAALGSEPAPLRLPAELRAWLASWRAMTSERLYHFGAGGGIILFTLMPLIQIGLLALIYGVDSDLFAYAAVAQAAGGFVMSAFFWVGEILDRERVKGTLVALFLAPCARVSWLAGFMLADLVERAIVTTVALLVARYGFGVTFDPNPLTLAVVFPLFLLTIWGIGIVCSGIGLLVRKANAFANLAWALVMPLGGLFVPVSELPDGVRHLARLLPFGYGLQAIADASLHHASLREVAPDLLPLAGFALALPLLGILAFGWLERKVRVRGELDVY